MGVQYSIKSQWAPNFYLLFIYDQGVQDLLALIHPCVHKPFKHEQ